MSKRRNSALALLALAAAAVFVLPASSASAATATVDNACANSVTGNFSQIAVATSGDDGLTTVAPGGATTTTGLSQSGAVPGAIFIAGYNLGLLQPGVNNIPATVNTKIEGTNTTQGTQTSSNAATAVTTTITDPDGAPGTGDESATPATFTANYSDLSWTAGANGTIDYRQESIPAAPPTAASNSLLINAVVGGVFPVQFRCAPGTVTPPDPGTITLIDPAPSFDTTDIVTPPDATGVVIVNGPVSSTKTSKSFVYKVTNAGTVPFTINETNITGSVDVNTTLDVGDVTVNPFTKTLNPGASTRVKLSWSYTAGELATGNSVLFHACVTVAGDFDTANDCGSATRTAK